MISLKVRPLITTYGDIIQMICERNPDLDPNQYYIASNYEIQMGDDTFFERDHQSFRLQMIMKTPFLLEYIAEQAMQRQKLKPEMRHILDTPDTERNDFFKRTN